MITWDYAAAAHLLRRAGFGAPRAEVEKAVRRGRAETVERLLAFKPANSAYAGDDGYYAQRWWLRRMLTSKAPLQEKLVLFWHGHFATSVAKVDDVRLMSEQNRLFRRMGAGKFRDLVIAVAKDAAMILWLDTIHNVKEHPNENYGRELFELFTLGITDEQGAPNYTETDVREAARAFTGFTFEYRRSGPIFYVDTDQHDDGQKTVLGLTGNLDGDAVGAHVAGLPACARFLARRLWTFFAYPDPEQEIVDALAQVYLANDTAILPVLRAMFLHDAFHSARARAERVSPPVEYALATLRALSAKTNATELPKALAAMGQDLFNPPNVAGWPGGLSWMTSVRQLERFRFAWRVAAARYGEKAVSVRLDGLLAGLPRDATPPQVVDRVLETLGPIDVGADARGELVSYLTTSEDGSPLPFDIRDKDLLDLKVRGLVGIALQLPEAHLV